MIFEISTLDQLDSAAVRLLQDLRPGVVGLTGPLGSGKTTFVKRIAYHLGIETEVISPTFLYEQSYLLPRTDREIQFLSHIDLYRLPTDQARVDLGIECADSKTIYLVEWIEHSPLLLNQALECWNFRLNPGGQRWLNRTLR
ncbi:tRNA (adenosine(37)-N6)-threonylcarbamoyltransferase complex ATPase subunit type 1 TsaE [Candidatus Berkelbacteria bacterium]|nr:tRNA (adenosine(37)-N6)-threonylcarbamoyltransferase complex ATPase subunit type 1 TsaE [Candidatus Berkelbacteria bacterium]